MNVQRSSLGFASVIAKLIAAPLRCVVRDMRSGLNRPSFARLVDAAEIRGRSRAVGDPLIPGTSAPVTARQDGGHQTQTNSADRPPFPSGKFSGLMFGDYYRNHPMASGRDQQLQSKYGAGAAGTTGSDAYTLPTTGLYSERLTTRLRLEANSDGQFEGGNLEPVREGCVSQVDVSRTPAADVGPAAQSHLRLAGRVLGAASRREDACGPLSD